jgi:kelch-like protein 2/3
MFSDSMSCLQAIENQDTDHPIIHRILDKLHQLKTQTKEVTFCWIPSHIGIAGNSRADQAAKTALRLPKTEGEIPYSDLKPRITSYIRDEWQRSWDTQTNNKLHGIRAKILATRAHIRTSLSRKDQMVFNRLQLGHSRLTHSYLRKGEDPPECIPCQEKLTVEHILINCVDFDETRRKYYSSNSLKDLFSSTEPTTILSFLKDINLYHKM